MIVYITSTVCWQLVHLLCVYQTRNCVDVDWRYPPLPPLSCIGWGSFTIASTCGIIMGTDCHFFFFPGDLCIQTISVYNANTVYMISQPMRPKARGLALHGGSPGWLEESDPAGCDFVRDGRSMPPALTHHTTCLGLIYYWMYTKHRHELCHTRKAWPGTLVDSSLCSQPPRGGGGGVK